MCSFSGKASLLMSVNMEGKKCFTGLILTSRGLPPVEGLIFFKIIEGNILSDHVFFSCSRLGQNFDIVLAGDYISGEISLCAFKKKFSKRHVVFVLMKFVLFLIIYFRKCLNFFLLEKPWPALL